MATAPLESQRQEAQRILALVHDDAHQGYQILERQLGVLVLRTQVMLSLCGIVVTVTGFSGRAIAQTSDLARASISTGILVVLGSAITAIVGVLRLRWLTQSLGEDPLETLVLAIQQRDRKSRFLSVALLLFVVGFSLYCFAIAQLLYAARP